METPQFTFNDGITSSVASHFAELALHGIHREYPNKLDHVINGYGDLQSPRALHPAFYGCFDWHSSVHGHWMLVRLLRLLPDWADAYGVRAALAQNLTQANLQVELAYLQGPNRRSFERTYGWAWLLKLAEELTTWDDPQGQDWARWMQPLADAFVGLYVDFLPKQTYPIRVGTHSNTAFGIAFALDYARTVGNSGLEGLLAERALHYFSSDEDSSARWEPNGNDFFSPSLIEADLMRRILTPDRFVEWFGGFLPGIGAGEPANLLSPAVVSDRTDPQIVHLDGLNLTRAWCMKGIASALAVDDPRRAVLLEAAEKHAQASLPHIASGDYMGEHWLASFAVYMLSL
ncbi:MAG: DUF2891 domain-containing protein [Chloroflexia bacterium]